MAMPEESLQEYLDEKQGVTKPAFVVDDDQKAEWALRKLSALNAQEEQIRKQFDDYVQQGEEWEKARLKRTAGEKERFIAMLTAYAQMKRKQDSKFKTLKLPHGKLGFRKQQPKWTVDKSVGDWLYDNGHQDLVRVKKEPELAKLKKAGFIVKDNRLIDPDSGEIIPGIEVDVREDKTIVEAIGNG